jgi:signal transduction histidine kinase
LSPATLEPVNASPFPSADEINQRLVDQYTEIATLAGTLAHEIKNPLSTIRLNMELLAEDLGEGDTPRDKRALAKVAVVQRECQRLQDLLDGFLSFARVRPMQLEPADLNAEVEELLHFFRPKAEESGIEIRWYPDPDLPTVQIDREALRGALLNLIINAQQAMPGGGQLMLRTQPTRWGVRLDLVDNGCGMDDDTRSKIFQAFYSTKRGGSGLGLPITRKVIEGHGGIIWVQSEVGRGTQFTIELPVTARLPAGGASADN